jgi:hypothetical protein
MDDMSVTQWSVMTPVDGVSAAGSTELAAAQAQATCQECEAKETQTKEAKAKAHDSKRLLKALVVRREDDFDQRMAGGKEFAAPVVACVFPAASAESKAMDAALPVMVLASEYAIVLYDAQGPFSKWGGSAGPKRQLLRFEDLEATVESLRKQQEKAKKERDDAKKAAEKVERNAAGPEGKLPAKPKRNSQTKATDKGEATSPDVLLQRKIIGCALSSDGKVLVAVAGTFRKQDSKDKQGTARWEQLAGTYILRFDVSQVRQYRRLSCFESHPIHFSFQTLTHCAWPLHTAGCGRAGCCAESGKGPRSTPFQPKGLKKEPGGRG